jgi:hypothetical protein
MPVRERRRRLLCLLCLLAAALPQAGCNAVLSLGYIFGGPPMREPDFEKRTPKESVKGKDKKVLVFAYAPTKLKWDNEAVDYELAKYVAVRLMMNKITVIDPDRVHAWLDKNTDWNKATEVGAAFHVDYVIHIDIKDYSLFEENSKNELYRGRADALVTVHKMDENGKDGTAIYVKDIVSRFPTKAPVHKSQKSYAEFKKLYLSALSDEIGRLFYPAEPGAEIPNTALND